MEFHVLGPVEVLFQGRSLALGGRRERALLARLLLAANRVVSCDRLVDDLWAGHPPEGAAQTLHVYVSRLRRALRPAGGREMVVTQPPGYLLRVDPEAVDALRFEALLARGREQAGGGQHVEAAETLREALALWRGTPFADLADADFARPEVARLEEARLAALEERIDADLAVGRHRALVGELEALTRAYPLRERLWGQRIVALYRTGRQADALRVYQQLRRILGEELGIEPSAALAGLERAILRQDPTLASPATDVMTFEKPTVAIRPGPPSSGVDGAEGVAALLFTDLVASTEVLSRLGDEAADELRRAHFRLLREAVGAHGGTEIKTLGDGIMASFPSSLAALRCAVAIQRGVVGDDRQQAVPLAVRIGLHAGEPMRDEGDLFGTPVVVAKRLCEQAEGGQILVSALLRQLTGRRGEDLFMFRHLGGLALKGLPDPVATYDVVWDGAPTDGRMTTEPVPLPLPLRRDERLPLVGRAGPLAQLQRQWTVACSGERQLVLLAGEPGIGKSRLAAEFARQAHAQGATALFGRCEEGMGVPYQPFVEALGRYIREAPSLALGRLAGELVRLLPEVAERVHGLPPPLRSDPETERYRLFDALVAWLSALSQTAPVLFVLDDLQWATTPTVLLLRHLVRAEEHQPLLVVAAYRESPLDMSGELADTIAELLRQPGVERLRLGGLDAVEVTALMEAQAGHQLDDEGKALAALLHAETGGNPFFLKELLRHLAERGSIVYDDGRWVAGQPVFEVEVPDSVREVVARRLSRLPDDSRDALALAAVLGERFELAVLVGALGWPDIAVLRALGPAVAARLLAETGVGRYHFAHGLVRSTLQDGLGPIRGAQLHRAAGLAVEAVYGGDVDDHLPELAHHFARAGDRDRAVTYAALAGDRALAQLAPAEAASYYQRTVELLGSTDVPRRLELLICLGEAQRRAGDAGYRATLFEAARLARQQRDADALARAALANTRGLVMSTAGTVDWERVAVLEAALEAAGDAETSTRARLLATLGMELVWASDPARRTSLSDQALATARCLDDPSTLAHVLVSRWVTIAAPTTVMARFTETAHLLTVTESLDDPVLHGQALFLRGRSALEAGEIDEAVRCQDACRRVTADLSQPALSWFEHYNRFGLLLLAGELEEAERLAFATRDLGRSAAQAETEMAFALEIFHLRLEQGRLGGDLEPLLRREADDTRLPLFESLLALLLCELGRDGEAQNLLERLSPDGVPFNNFWLMTTTTGAVAATELGDTHMAKAFYDALCPYPDQVVVLLGVATGLVARYLGLLATTLGRLEEADDHFAFATTCHTAMGAPTWVARSRLDWMRMLLARGQPTDLERARTLGEQAVATAREVGLADIERRTLALLDVTGAGA